MEAHHGDYTMYFFSSSMTSLYISMHGRTIFIHYTKATHTKQHMQVSLNVYSAHANNTCELVQAHPSDYNV